MENTKERAGCTVCALAAVANLPYEVAAQIAAKAGRVRSRRFKTSALVKFAHAQGFEFRKLALRRPRTLARFMREYPHGRYIVRAKGHALAVIDGAKSDQTADGRRIVQAWRYLGANGASVPA